MGILADWQIKRDVKITPAVEYNRDEQLGKISYGYSSYGYDARIGYKFWVFDPIACGGVINPKKFDKKMLREVDLTPEGHKWQDPYPPKNESLECFRCGAWKGTPSENWICSSKPQSIIVPPGNCVLGETVEEFQIPRDVLCIVLGKSTYARCGLVINVTPGEPEWCGKWTVEISNTSPLPVELFCGEGIMQCLFLRSDGRDEAAVSVLAQLISQSERKDKLYEQLHEDTTCTTSYADKKGKYQAQTGLTAPTVTKKEE